MMAIIELVTELIVALLTAVANLLTSLLELLARAIGLSVEIAASKPTDGGSRLRVSHIALALLPLAAFAVLVVGILLALDWYSTQERQRREQTRVIVEREADKLWALKDGKGRPLPVPKNEQRIDDAWGRPITRVVDHKLLNDEVVVRSFGSDGEEGTVDDIVAVRTQRNQNEAIRDEAVDRLIDFVKGFGDAKD